MESYEQGKEWAARWLNGDKRAVLAELAELVNEDPLVRAYKVADVYLNLLRKSPEQAQGFSDVLEAGAIWGGEMPVRGLA